MGKRTVLLAAAYLLLLGLSRALEGSAHAPRPGAGAGRVAVRIHPRTDQGPLDGPRAELSLLHWPAPEGSPSLAPLVCLHGSPGSARNFERLGPRLAAGGREVWAVDLPGFGRSRGPVGGYSILAHARAVLALLDALAIERAHLLGWSMGGGVALHVAALAPERVASLALVASIGVQDAEGSGSYAFEHAKYLALLGGCAALDGLVPHFGRLAALRREGRSFARNFWESDQRPLRDVLARLSTPLLLLHGREDVLVPLHAAAVSHELVRDSRLVVLDANHFLPILQVDELTAELEPFLARHEAPGVREPRARREPRPPRGWRRLDPPVLALGRALPWWLQVAAIALAAAWFPFNAAVAVGAAVAAAQLDFGLVALALAAGSSIGVARRRRRTGRRCWQRWVRAPLAAWGWMLLTLALALAIGPLPELLGSPAPPRSLAPLLALLLLYALAGPLRARRGRASLGAGRTLG